MIGTGGRDAAQVRNDIRVTQISTDGQAVGRPMGTNACHAGKQLPAVPKRSAGRYRDDQAKQKEGSASGPGAVQNRRHTSCLQRGSYPPPTVSESSTALPSGS